MVPPPTALTLEVLQEAVRGNAVAFTCSYKLQPVGGDGDKVFPPTYVGGVYATEKRWMEGSLHACVLLDSIQSQANRMEAALLDAFLPDWRDMNAENVPPACDLPVLAVRVGDHGWVTSLTAPHRVYDAILRDSSIKESQDAGVQFVRFGDSRLGKRLAAARSYKALALYEHCPTALLFGAWNSTAGGGPDVARFERAIVSEIIGVDMIAGVRTASRIDPIGIKSSVGTIYRSKANERDWTQNPDEAARDAKGNEKRFGKDGNPSSVNHGNVTPDMPRFSRDEVWNNRLDRLPDILSNSGQMIRAGAVKPGGVTIAYALHKWVLSLAQLRNLRFPADDRTGAARNEAGRTVLAALAFHALALVRERGMHLRSRCDLYPEKDPVIQLVGGSEGNFNLGSSTETRAILSQACQAAETSGLHWCGQVTFLRPLPKLMDLIAESDGIPQDDDAQQDEIGLASIDGDDDASSEG